MYGCGKDCLILIPFRLPQISCFTFSLKYFSSDSDNCPDVGMGPLLQFPHPLRAGPALPHSCFLPLFLHPTEFCVGLHIFSIRYPCPLPAGVLHGLLCFKVYSFFFLIAFFFFFYFILLYNTVLGLPYINMNLPRVYTCSRS